nr:hypothetical protein [Phycicoccus elongatus]
MQDEHGRILLIHRTDNNLWDLPGGAMRSVSRSWTRSCAR